MNGETQWLVTVVLVTLLVGVGIEAEAGIYYVAQGHSKAADSNPGTEEQPWQTLTHAAATAQRGDTVFVKTGTYREQLRPANDGGTFLAFANDHVVLLPDDDITVLEPNAWSKLPDSQSVYVCHPQTEGVDSSWLLRVDGLAVAFELTQGVRSEVISGISERRSVEVDRTLADDDWRRWSLDPEGRLYLNLGGEDSAKHRVELIKSGLGGSGLRHYEGWHGQRLVPLAGPEFGAKVRVN